MSILTGEYNLSQLKEDILRKSYEDTVSQTKVDSKTIFTNIVSTLFNTQNFLEHCHRKTLSEPKHRALGEAYKEFAVLKDKIIEQITGLLGRQYNDTLNLIPYLEYSPEMCDIVATNIVVVGSEIEKWANNMNFSSVSNLAQELAGIGATLKFKLGLSGEVRTSTIEKSEYDDFSLEELSLEKAQFIVDLKLSDSIEKTDSLTKSIEILEELILEKGKKVEGPDPRVIAQMVLDGTDKSKSDKTATDKAEPKKSDLLESKEKSKKPKEEVPFTEDGKTYDQTIQPGHEVTASDGTVGKVVDHDGVNASIEYAKNGNVENTIVPGQTLEKLKAEGKIQHNAKPKTMKDHHKQQLEEKYTSGEGDAQSFLGAAKGMGVDEDEALEHYIGLKKKWPKKKVDDTVKKSEENDLIKGGSHSYISKHYKNGRWTYDYGQHFNGSQRAEDTNHSTQEENYQQHLADTVLSGTEEIEGLMAEHQEHQKKVDHYNSISHHPQVSQWVKDSHKRTASKSFSRQNEIISEVNDIHNGIIQKLNTHSLEKAEIKSDEELLQNIDNALDKLVKSEGSRGGVVIGHTQSGKPIYANKSASNKVYHDFTEEDHKDAMDLHNKEHKKSKNFYTNKIGVDHFDRAWSHQQKTEHRKSNSSVGSSSNLRGALQKSEEDNLQKGGKRAQIGEVRTYDGKKWVKHSDGWVYVNSKSGGHHILERPGGKREEASSEHVEHAVHHLNNHMKAALDEIDKKENDSNSEDRENLTQSTKEDLDQKISDKLDSLFQQLVPSNGPAKTVEGEVVRAINKIGYRFYNDGDKWNEGYGTETAGPAAAFLESKQSQIPGLKEALSMMDRWGSGSSKNDYEQGLKLAFKAVVDYVESKKGVHTPNTEDMFDYESKYPNEYMDDNDDDDIDDDDDESYYGR